MNSIYHVKKLENSNKISVEVPGSKSMTNRALLLAALSNNRCILKGVLFSDDSRAFLSCLQELGFEVRIKESEKMVEIQGMAGTVPNTKAALQVRSAGTAARFLTVMLSFAGGEYEMDSSEQMKKRPMQPLLNILEQAGVEITYKEKAGYFPFVIKSKKPSLREVNIDTGTSSQFASALLMSGVMLKNGLTVNMTGNRQEGSYIKMTLAMMKQFGISTVWEGNTCKVPQNKDFGRDEYQIEPDVSGACYFYALAPVLKTDILVKKIYMNSLQGDILFLRVMEKLGCVLEEQADGMLLKGSSLTSYQGITLDMEDFSDQTMTMAAVAAFAESPTKIINVGHIRYQESDRITAIITELKRMGIVCKEIPEEEGIMIVPGEIMQTEIETYEDHRMAMAFTIIGLRTGNITIKNPECCTKTFENFFEIVDRLV